MLHDLRYALRALRRQPGFALTAIASIAAGVGANASVFSFVDGILLRPLPVPNPSTVVTLQSRTPGRSLFGGAMSWGDYTDFRDRSRSFAGILACQPLNVGFAVDASTQPKLKQTMLVSGNVLDVLGVTPSLGRGFRPEEDRVPGRDAVAVLSYDFWANELQSDHSIVGRSIKLNGVDFTVVGIAPKDFTGVVEFTNPAIYVPAAMGPALASANQNLLTDRSLRVFTAKGRLRRSISLAAANAESELLAQSLAATYPATNKGFGAAVLTELQARLEISPLRLLVPILLFALVATLLAIACANVANLTLARARCRTREIGVRLAIGASRLRLLRQLFAESLVIAAAGGALGLLLASSFAHYASAIRVPGDVPIELSFQLDSRAFWFTALVSAASAALFGLGPALQSVKTDLVPALKAREADQARQRLMGRSTLVVAQLAGSLVLLAVAAHLVAGFSRQLSRDPGFRRDHILTLSLDPSLLGYSAVQTGQFYDALRQHALSTPGVRSIAIASTIPTGTNPRFEQLIPEGYQFPDGQTSVAVWTSIVDEGYFETLNVPILSGRGFRTSDGSNAPQVAVVNEAFARRYLQPNPIGKRIRLQGPNTPWIEVVGLTATGKYLSIMEPATEAIYLPYRQHDSSRMTLLALTQGDPAQLARPLQDMVRSLDPNLPVFTVRTMQDYFEQRSVKAAGLVMQTVSAIGALGALLALVGLYAVVAYQVAARTREIGIRMAIGARPQQVRNMILKQGARMSLPAAAIGLILSAIILGALNNGPLSAPFDYPILLALSTGLLLTTLIASVIPAWRAARTDPLRAIRED
jgi:macrolide transport system ATP-binding/permease protein